MLKAKETKTSDDVQLASTSDSAGRVLRSDSEIAVPHSYSSFLQLFSKEAPPSSQAPRGSGLAGARGLYQDPKFRAYRAWLSSLDPKSRSMAMHRAVTSEPTLEAETIDDTQPSEPVSPVQTQQPKPTEVEEKVLEIPEGKILVGTELMTTTQALNQLIGRGVITVGDADDVEPLLAQKKKFTTWDQVVSLATGGDSASDSGTNQVKLTTRMFYHGTSSLKAARSIMKNIQVGISSTPCDFDVQGTGSSFYVTNDLAQAQDWPKFDRQGSGKQGGGTYIVAFEVSKKDLLKLNGLLFELDGGHCYSETGDDELSSWLDETREAKHVDRGDASQWHAALRVGRQGSKEGGFAKYDYLEGRMCGNPGNIGGTKSLAPTGHQLTLLSKKALALFNAAPKKLYKYSKRTQELTEVGDD